MAQKRGIALTRLSTEAAAGQGDLGETGQPLAQPRSTMVLNVVVAKVEHAERAVGSQPLAQPPRALSAEFVIA